MVIPFLGETILEDAPDRLGRCRPGKTLTPPRAGPISDTIRIRSKGGSAAVHHGGGRREDAYLLTSDFPPDISPRSETSPRAERVACRSAGQERSDEAHPHVVCRRCRLSGGGIGLRRFHPQGAGRAHELHGRQPGGYGPPRRAALERGGEGGGA